MRDIAQRNKGGYLIALDVYLQQDRTAPTNDRAATPRLAKAAQRDVDLTARRALDLRDQRGPLHGDVHRSPSFREHTGH